MPVVFDMDGVLVDSEIHWKKIESRFLKQLIPHWTEELQHSIIGMSAYDVHAYLTRDHGVSLSHEEFVGYYQGLAASIYGTQSSLLPGVRELIERLRREHVRLGLASSSPHAWIDIVLDRFQLRGFFEAVLSSDDVHARGKPHPDIYLAAAERLGVVPAECVAVEDSKKGVESALSAGMRCVGLRNGFNDHQDLSKADLVVEAFAELSPDLLKRLEKDGCL